MVSLIWLISHNVTFPAHFIAICYALWYDHNNEFPVIYISMNWDDRWYMMEVSLTFDCCSNEYFAKLSPLPFYNTYSHICVHVHILEEFGDVTHNQPLLCFYNFSFLCHFSLTRQTNHLYASDMTSIKLQWNHWETSISLMRSTLKNIAILCCRFTRSDHCWQ